MQIYFITFLILTILSLYEISSKNKNSIQINIFVILTAIWLVFITGFRGPVYGDYCTYWYFFEALPSLVDYFFWSVPIPGDISTEWTYNILFPMLIKTFTENHLAYFTFVPIVTIGIYFFTIKKMSPIIFLSLLIYCSHAFLYKELQQIRSGLGSSLILLSIYFLSISKPYGYISSYIIASFIHVTSSLSILGIFVKYAISLFKQKKTIMLFLLVLTIIIGSTGLPINMLSYLEGLIQLPVKYYVYKDPIGGAGSTNFYSIGIFGNITTVKYIFFSFISIIFYDELAKRSIYFKYTFFFYFTGTLWIIFFNDFAIIATRIASIFTVAELILLPQLVFLFKEKGIAFIFLIMFAFLQLLTNLFVLSNVPTYEFT